MSYTESRIDEYYRLMLLEHHLENAKEIPFYNGHRKWQFICPFCGSLSSKEYKKKERKGALLWDCRQNSWVFYCAKKGSIECMNSKSFSNFISALNPALGEAYRRDRRHSGTTGKEHNCGAYRGAVGLSTSGNKFPQTRGVETLPAECDITL